MRRRVGHATDMPNRNQDAARLRLLHPTLLKENLAKVGLYLLAYELLEYSVIQCPKNFLTIWGSTSEARYKGEILAKRKTKEESLVMPSCRWLLKNGVLTSDDVQEIRRIRKHRTDIAHKMREVLMNPDTQVDQSKLRSICVILSKIDGWFITTMEAAAQDLLPSQVKSGRALMLEYMVGAVYENFRIH